LLSGLASSVPSSIVATKTLLVLASDRAKRVAADAELGGAGHQPDEIKSAWPSCRSALRFTLRGNLERHLSRSWIAGKGPASEKCEG
jgi:hypothetical protein